LLSGEGGSNSRAIGVSTSNATISATRGQHILLHECFTKFNVLRDMVISCASKCSSGSEYLCQAKMLPLILSCDCKAEAEEKIQQYNDLMNLIKSNCLEE
jgi:hypothetical protein